MRAFDAALGTPWAMLPAQLETLLSIASRENEVTPEVLQAYRAKSVARAETLEQRGNVAVLNITGPLFRRANLFTEISGATSYDVLRRDLQVALDDEATTAILLNIDSPGGDANGCGELAKAIFDARATKPIVAYVEGTAASGGYWLASAASEVVADDAALLGSIGVVLSLRDTKGREAAQGVKTFEFVSSQSPHKRNDPTSRAGEDDLQRLADDLADVFIGAVAKHRGVTAETVVGRFGAGGVLVGAKAVEAGMADRIGTFEDTLQKLQAGGRSPGRPSPRSSKGKVMSDTTGPKAGDDIDAIRAENDRLKTTSSTAANDAKARIKAIMTSPEAKGRQEQAEHLAYDTDLSVDAAIGILAKGAKDKGPDATEATATEVADYEAKRATGAGLQGGKSKASAGAPAVDLVANMRKLLNKDAA